MLKHEQFEELCSLAAVGQLSAQEQRLLDEHLEACRDCRAACVEFSSVLRELTVTEDATILLELRQAEENAYRQRFLARARSGGREFSAAAQRGRVLRGGAARGIRDLFQKWSQRRDTKWQQRWSVVVPLGFALVAGCTYLAVRESARAVLSLPQRLAPTVSAAAVPAKKLDDPSAQLLAEAQQSAAVANKNAEQLKSENDLLHEQLQTQDRDLHTAQSEKTQLASALDRSNEANAKLQSQSKEQDVQIAQVRNDLEKVRADRSETAASLAMEQRAVEDLSARLKVQNDGLAHEHELLAEGRDIRDLMGARNLHIIDVFDSDAKGKNRRSFGRVFYTEGKSLIFYAFDLDQGRAVDAKYSFEAWGEQLGQPSTVRNLGVFFADDKAQKRWVLKLEDPLQIAQINSVFVTLEPTGENAAPHGKKILYAFLGGGANHP